MGLRTHNAPTAPELVLPKIPSKRQPANIIACGKFTVRLDRVGLKLVQVTARETGTLFAPNWQNTLLFNYQRFYHKHVWAQLLPLLLLDAVPENWLPVLPPHPKGVGSSKARAIRSAGPYHKR